MKLHKHAALIHAWADGAQVQRLYHYPNNPTWKDVQYPDWDIRETYRIKPREFNEGAWYPTLSNGNKGVHQYVGGMFCTHENYPEFPEYSFDWIGDKLEIEWPEEVQ